MSDPPRAARIHPLTGGIPFLNAGLEAMILPWFWENGFQVRFCGYCSFSIQVPLLLRHPVVIGSSVPLRFLLRFLKCSFNKLKMPRAVLIG